MKPLKKVALVCFAVFIAGCSAGPDLAIDKSLTANPWTHLNFYNDPANFQFAIVSDRTGGHRPGVFASAIDKVNLLKPEFVICIGDLIEGYTEDVNELNSQWDEIDAMVNRLDMPFFYFPGNHDISNALAGQIWQKRLGRSYYYFKYHNVLFLCLNTEDPPSRRLSDTQIEYFRKVLEANRSVRWTLVFMHQPLWKGKSIRYWQRIETLLAGRPYTVFAGHEHHYQKYVVKGRNYYILATTGGAMKDDEKCRLDHVVWVTITDEGPQIANLRLDGILTDQPCLQN